MLVFGPYHAIPKDVNLVVYNLSSLTQAIPRLPGLMVDIRVYQGSSDERDFDIWYYDYVLQDPIACSSLMSILKSLYDGNNVYICIADYSSNDIISMINESFMKLIQTRYDIKYSIINEPEDFDYIPKDGCDFMSARGIITFDEDNRRYLQLCIEDQLSCGMNPNQVSKMMGAEDE